MLYKDEHLYFDPTKDWAKKLGVGVLS